MYRSYCSCNVFSEYIMASLVISKNIMFWPFIVWEMALHELFLSEEKVIMGDIFRYHNGSYCAFVLSNTICNFIDFFRTHAITYTIGCMLHNAFDMIFNYLSYLLYELFLLLEFHEESVQLVDLPLFWLWLHLYWWLSLFWFSAHQLHDSCGVHKHFFIYWLRVGNTQLVGTGEIKTLHKKNTSEVRSMLSVLVMVQLELRLMSTGVHKLR